MSRGSETCEAPRTRYCLLNYTVECRDVTSGKIGCFLFDPAHWVATGEFRAISPVFPDLDSFFAWNEENGRPGGPAYIERIASQ